MSDHQHQQQQQQQRGEGLQQTPSTSPREGLSPLPKQPSPPPTESPTATVAGVGGGGSRRLWVSPSPSPAGPARAPTATAVTMGTALVGPRGVVVRGPAAWGEGLAAPTAAHSGGGEQQQEHSAAAADRRRVGDIAATIYQSEQQRVRQERLDAIKVKRAGKAAGVLARDAKRRMAVRLRRRVFALKVLGFVMFMLGLGVMLGSALIVNLDRWSRIEGTPVAMNGASSWEEVNPYSGYCYCESASSSIVDLLTSASGSSASAAAGGTPSSSSSLSSDGTAASLSSSSSSSSSSAVVSCSEASNSFEGVATLSIILISLEVVILTLLLWEAAYYGRFGGSHTFTRIVFALLLLASITAILSFVAAYIVIVYEFCGLTSFVAMGVRFGIAVWMRLLESVVILLVAVTTPLAFRGRRGGGGARGKGGADGKDSPAGVASVVPNNRKGSKSAASLMPVTGFPAVADPSPSTNATSAITTTATPSISRGQRGPQGLMLLIMSLVTSMSVISTCSRTWFVFDQQRFVEEGIAASVAAASASASSSSSSSSSSAITALAQSSAAGYSKGLGVAYVGPYAYLGFAARSAMAPAGALTTTTPSSAASASGNSTSMGGSSNTTALNESSTTTFAFSSSSSSSSSSSIATGASTIIANLVKGLSGSLTLLTSPPSSAVRYFGVRDSCQCTHPCAPSIATNRFGVVKTVYGLFASPTLTNASSTSATISAAAPATTRQRDLSTNAMAYRQSAIPTSPFTLTDPAAALLPTSPLHLTGWAYDFSIAVPLEEGASATTATQSDGGNSDGTSRRNGSGTVLLGGSDGEALRRGLVHSSGEGRNTLEDRIGMGFRREDDSVAWYLGWATAARIEAYVLSRVAAYTAASSSTSASNSNKGGTSSTSSSSSGSAIDAALAADPVKAIHLLTAASWNSIGLLFPSVALRSHTPYDVPYSTRDLFGRDGGSSDDGDGDRGSASLLYSPSLALMLPMYPQYPFLWGLLLFECLLGGVLFLFLVLRVVDNKGRSVFITQALALLMLCVVAVQLALTLTYGPASEVFECADMPSSMYATPSSSASSSSSVLSSSSSSLGSDAASSTSSLSSSFSISNTTLLALASDITFSVPQVGYVGSVPSNGTMAAPSMTGGGSGGGGGSAATNFSYAVREHSHVTTKAFVPYYAVYSQVAILAALVLLAILNGLYLPLAPLAYHDVSYRRRQFHALWWDILQDPRSLAREDREMAQLMRGGEGDGSDNTSASSSDSDAHSDDGERKGKASSGANTTTRTASHSRHEYQHKHKPKDSGSGDREGRRSNKRHHYPREGEEGSAPLAPATNAAGGDALFKKQFFTNKGNTNTNISGTSAGDSSPPPSDGMGAKERGGIRRRNVANGA